MHQSQGWGWEVRLTPHSFSQITLQLQKLMEKPPKLTNIDTLVLVTHVALQLKIRTETSKINKMLAEVLYYKMQEDLEYKVLVLRLLVLNLYKTTTGSVLEHFKTLWFNKHPINDSQNPFVWKDIWWGIQRYHQELQVIIDYKLDYNYSYFGLQTMLQKGAYLATNKKKSYYSDESGQVDENG